MSKTNLSSHKATLTSYVIGLIFSIILTVEAYLMVVNNILDGAVLIATITALAIIQLLIQLVFFLHLGDEPKPRWNLRVLWFAILVVIIVVFGSLWIMTHLSYNHATMSPEQINTHIEDEEAIKK